VAKPRIKTRAAAPSVITVATLTAQEAQALADAVRSTAPQKISLTPEKATTLLEHNQNNRPISDQHVQRIARQILEGKWKYNGDTIKISDTGDVLDGQHRLWAIIEAQIAVDTVIVYGIERDAFSTIDTVRKLRSAGDTIALNGQVGYRSIIGSALAWLLRWQRGVLENYKAPPNRIENSDIEAAFAAHRGMERAVAAAVKARRVANPAITGFCYYVMSNQNPKIAEQFLEVLIDPAGVSVSHPFFRLRSYFLTDKQKTKDPILSIALCFKAANAAAGGRDLMNLTWRSQGTRPEAYPRLDITAKDATRH
jgi:hypothetical protein